jgi:TonB family protein
VSFPARLSTLLARMERRHWVGLGASLVLHLAVLFGLRQAPPPEPEPVSFEIALEAPKPEPQVRAKTKTPSRLTDAKAKLKKTLAKRKPAKVKQAKREPHTLEAQWRGETRPPKDAPKLDLPDAREMGIEAPEEVAAKPTTVASRQQPAAATPARAKSTETSTEPPRAQAQGSKAAAAQAEPGLSEPGHTGAAISSQSGAGGGPGIALAASPGLSRSASANLGNTPGAQGMETTAGLSASGKAASAGQGPGSLASSQGSGTGLNVAAGNGAQSRSSLEAPALAGGEPQGIRLTAAGVLAARSDLPTGGGGLTAGPASVESGRATPSHAQGSGASLTSARAGSASANPLSIPGKRAGGGAGGALAERSASQAGASKQGPARLAGSGGQGKTSASADKPITRNTKAGGAMSDRPSSRGDASGAGMTLVAGDGRLGVATASVDHIRIKSPGSGAGTSQSGASLALAPGEPGSSPRLAVAMRPLVAKPGVGRGGDREGIDGGKGLAGVSTGTGGAYAGVALARSGGGEAMIGAPSGLGLTSGQGGASVAPASTRGVPGGHGTLSGGASALIGAGAATGQAKDPARLQTVKVAENQVIRPDTQAKPLDVLAPSTYCPLPLPGHSFPNNRPPKSDPKATTQPSYAQDNPSFMFPIQAWASNIQGNAVVRVEVLPDGKPGRMWLKQSSGSGILDRDAQSQLTFWRFNPAMKNGQPVTAWIDVPVVYRLQDANK